MEPYQDKPLLLVVEAEGVDWISESSESVGENEIEIVASTSTVLADNGERASATLSTCHHKSRANRAAAVDDDDEITLNRESRSVVRGKTEKLVKHLPAGVV
ncbi:hypothetical protein ACOMHN_030719 [Nucella lapillus]